MVTTDTHQNQDLMVPSQVQDLQDQFHNQDQGQTSALDQPLASTLDQDLTSTLSALDPEKIGQGPVNAITVLTLLDKLVHMLDAVQENQHKMEVHQVEMENVVRGIQADMVQTVQEPQSHVQHRQQAAGQEPQAVCHHEGGEREDGATGRPSEEAGGKPRPPDQQEQLQSADLPGT
ncbi:unnamed protein product, partial [Lampetra planeri]